ncbi:hypothetical protein cypCar_00030972 [Cyprinus carpio]|nr:hypothetical protein cypCar_00030972 [Cyprinus carpio]
MQISILLVSDLNKCGSAHVSPAVCDCVLSPVTAHYGGVMMMMMMMMMMERRSTRSRKPAAVDRTAVMESVFRGLSAAVFLNTWTQFSRDDGLIEHRRLDEFLHCLMKTLKIVAAALLPEQENFLLLFRRETPMENSVEFMRIWRCYDTDSSGYISAAELKLISNSTVILSGDFQMKMFDKNQDGRLDLNDLARILALKENFLLKFEMEATVLVNSVSGVFLRPAVRRTDGETLRRSSLTMTCFSPSLTGSDLDKFKQVLLGHCDINRDGKIQRNDLALCLGLKLNP